MRPQNYYKGNQERTKKQADAQWIKQMVQEKRKLHPRMGGKKSYEVLKPAMRKLGIDVGRDIFLQAYKNEGLTLSPLRRKPRTTNSRHNLPVFPNQFKDMEPAHSSQPGLGIRYNLHQHRSGVPVFEFDNRCLLEEDCGFSRRRHFGNRGLFEGSQ